MSGSNVLMAGFGGQGLLLAGKVLAHAAMDVGFEVSWLPSYGPEMRGGTANVTVCIATEPIGSPLISKPDVLVAMNLPSLEKFAATVRPGGIIIVNSTLISADPGRDDCQLVCVDSRAKAREAGNDRAANFVVLGTYVGVTGVVAPESIAQAIATEFSGSKSKFAAGNVAAFEKGYECGRGERVTS